MPPENAKGNFLNLFIDQTMFASRFTEALRYPRFIILLVPNTVIEICNSCDAYRSLMKHQFDPKPPKTLNLINLVSVLAHMSRFNSANESIA
jgi:hypothetical protein